MANREQTITLNAVERLQRRRERIELLMRIEFPGSNAPPPLPTISGSTTRTSIEVAQANIESWQQRRDAQDARRAELAKLPDEQFDDLVNQALAREQERDRHRRERQTPPAEEPEWHFWIREDEWMLHDAALLLVNLESRTGLGLHIKRMARGEYDSPGYVREDQTPGGLSDGARPKFEKVQEIVRRALVARQKGKLAVEFGWRIDDERQHGAVEPHSFLLWAASKDYDIPPALRRMAYPDQPQVMPATDIIASPAAARRRDILSPVIEKAMQGTDGTAAEVWPRLREMAMIEQPPFNGIHGSALLYTKADNRSAKFTQDALRKRLKRTQGKPPQPR